MKRIPYGIENFERLIRGNYYFVDHSQYIEYIEKRASYILLLRPRRMGKSLFSSMLMSYYDIAKKDYFNELFGNLYIGQHPTPEANKYVVLKLDFSKIGKVDIEELPEAFFQYCKFEINYTFSYYGDLFTASEKETVLSGANAGRLVDTFDKIVKSKGLQSYLFIDEYDNFSNTVLTTHGVKAHEKITHGEGFYREFFKCCKGNFDRIYMTGVAPVTYDDLTSGFNIASIIALEPKYNHILGISETELRTMIDYCRNEGCFEMETDAVIAEMKPWYDNFCFSSYCYGKEAPIYNPAMVMNYMNFLLDNGIPPEEMIDYNARIDYKKLNYLVKAEDLDNREARFQILREICNKGYTIGNVKKQFPACEVGDLTNFKSMLFYYGALTFGGNDTRGGQKLIVTNKTMADLYLDYMVAHVYETAKITPLEKLQLEDAIAEAAVDGKWQPMIEKAGRIFNQYSSVRNAIYGEPDAQGFLRGLLCLNDYFDIWPELELNQGFSDLLLIPRADENCFTRYSYIIELKYMKSEDNNVEKAINEAKTQLLQYVQDIHLKTSGLLRGTPCTLLYIIVKGREFIKYGEIEG
ncbi:MAG: ATP-binding protein [Bacteroidales bacterium]|nr:ATP-binding protein [Bacteroidales bacterium]